MQDNACQALALWPITRSEIETKAALSRDQLRRYRMQRIFVMLHPIFAVLAVERPIGDTRPAASELIICGSFIVVLHYSLWLLRESILTDVPAARQGERADESSS